MLDIYPTNIVEDIRIAVDGLEFVYALPKPYSYSEAPKVLRTKFTPYSASPYNMPYGHRTYKCLTKKLLSSPLDQDMSDLDHWKPISQEVAGLYPLDVPSRDVRPSQREPYHFAEPTCPDDCWEAGHQHPIFTSPPVKSLGKLHGFKIEKSAKPDYERLQPHDEREFAWLTAFLRAVTWMRKLELRGFDRTDTIKQTLEDVNRN